MKRALQKFALATGLTALCIPGFLLASNNKQPRDLSDKVRHELVMLPYFSVFDNLAYRVDGNIVTLSGEVTRPVLKSDAEHAVKRLEGVAQVVNQIKVLPLSPFDNQIRRATYRAVFGYAGLYRYAMGVTPSVRIIVDSGHVTLEGIVGSQADKNAAGIRANGVPGVFSVTNNLLVSRS
jgi:hyperosmotically inducible protein